MPLSLFQQGSGERLLKGKSGLFYHHRGELWIGHAPRVGLDSHLIADLRLLCDHLGLRLWINSTDGGGHARGSRHYRGLAVDIDRIAPATKEWEPVAGDNHWARLVAVTLAAEGFRHYERGKWPAVLLGPPHSPLNATAASHDDHLHISLFR